MHVEIGTMAKYAALVCENADMGLPSADDLLILLAVGRTGRYTGAADAARGQPHHHLTPHRRAGTVDRRPGTDPGGRRSGS